MVLPSLLKGAEARNPSSVNNILRFLEYMCSPSASENLAHARWNCDLSLGPLCTLIISLCGSRNAVFSRSIGDHNDPAEMRKANAKYQRNINTTMAPMSFQMT